MTRPFFTPVSAAAGRSAGFLRAFTLIELLVVFVVMTLLIGLIFPVLSKAKASALAVVCRSNIRQLALANVSYTVDHVGYYVPGAAHAATNLRRWHGHRDALDQSFDPMKGPLWSYFEVLELKQCPQFEGFLSGFEAGNGGYGYNNEYVGRDVRGDIYTELGAKSEWFENPVRTLMFTDAAFVLPGLSDQYIEYSFAEPPLFVWGPADPSIHFRHGGSANVVWLDGHVGEEWLDFTRSNTYGTTIEQNRRRNVGWFGPADNELFDRN